MRYSGRVSPRPGHSRSVRAPLPSSSELTRLSTAYQALWQVFGQMSDRELKQRQGRLDRMMRELGVHFSLFEEKRSFDSDARVDPLPRILPAEEWETICRGVKQRVRMLDAFVRDAYGDQRVLETEMLKPEAVLGSRGFHYELAGLPFDWGAVALAALDLVRMPDGQWLVWEQQVSNPLGLAHVLNNRHLLSRAIPEIFDRFAIEPVSSFPVALSERLREIGERASGRRSPFVVMLTRAGSNESYFEESFLGRQMGIPIVRPGDLVIRNGAVFLRTIEGLRKVDVIFRRIPALGIDPVTFSRSTHEGIPGVVHCLRQGEVTVVNGLGTGLADDRALLRFSERLVGFYLGENCVLPSVPTLDLSERDQLVEALADPDRYHFSARLPSGDPFSDWEGYPAEAGDFASFVIHRASQLVARRRVDPETTSWRVDSSFKAAPQRLRVFCLLGPEPVILPGGLTESLPEGDAARGIVRLKDTWVLARPSSEIIRLDTDPEPYELPLGSRVANSMYWIGRYLERAENTSRMLATLERIPSSPDEAFAGDQAWLLWNSVAATVGGSKLGKSSNPVPRDPQRLATSFLLDTNDPNSVAQSIRQAMFLADRIREFLSPEFWSALSVLVRITGDAAGRRRLSVGESTDLCARIVSAAAGAFGTARRTFLHDAGWHFFSIGALLERTITTVNILERVLVRALERQYRYPFSDAGLTSLLLLTGSLDAYHRVYRSRAFVDRVARFLWQSEVAPNAVAYCLIAIQHDLKDLSRFGNVPWREPVRRVEQLLGQVRNLPIDRFQAGHEDRELAGGLHLDQATAERITGISTNIRASVEGLHDLLGDTFFSHQALPGTGKSASAEDSNAL